MGEFEEVYVYSNNAFKNNILLYKRYIDDLVFLWKGYEALKFSQYFNHSKSGIPFIPNISTTEIVLLDLLITHKGKKFLTSTFFKQVD